MKNHRDDSQLLAIRRTLPWVFLLFIVAQINGGVLGDDSAGLQKQEKLTRQIQVEMDYLLYLPQQYADKDKWPLLLFLHGAGERGDDLELVTVHGPPKLIKQGKHLPFIVVSPQCPRDSWWEPLELGALLDDVAANYKVDEDRIYVTGLSMGGFGTWSLAARYPQRFAAIAPICGGGERFRVSRFPHLPTWVFHGAKDTAVPIERSQQMVDEMRKWKSDVQFTIYPDAGHDSWTETYDNPKFYEWLLEHKRETLKSSSSQIDIRSHGDSTIAWVSSSSGIGRGVIERGAMTWPEQLTVRLRLTGLESLSISNGPVTLKVSVPSVGDGATLLNLWTDGKEGPQLDETSEYYTGVELLSIRGCATIPLRDGYIELRVPKPLLAANPKSLSLEWIDFYRG